MTKDNKIPKYLFIFNKGSLKEIVLPGKEIQDYWNLIFDLFWEENTMIVQKLNGEDFTKREIHELFWDLFENIWDDLTMIKLNLVSLSTLEFYNLGEIDISSFKKRSTGYKIDKAASKTIEDLIEKTRKRACGKFLSKAMASYNQKVYENLTVGFKVKNPLLLRKQEYSDLKRALGYYQNAISNKDKWALCLYHIIGKMNNKSPKISKTCRILNDASKYRSRHEGEGFRKKIKMKNYSKKEINFCNKTIKNLINSWITDSGMNNK